METTTDTTTGSVFSSSKTAPVMLVEINPTRGLLRDGLRELWSFRELLYFFVWRDVKARYKQTAFGVAWAVLQPLLTALVFTIVFSLLTRFPASNVPYPVFVLTALVPWTYFARSLERASNSVVDGSHLLTKVYFPRLIMPIGSVLSGLVDLVAALAILIAIIVLFGVPLSLKVATLPIFLLLAMMTALGVGFWAAALNVYYRDVKHVMPFIVQTWMFLTPVIYPISLVPERFRLIYSLNPMVAVVEGFRWALIGGEPLPGLPMAISILVTSLFLVTGLVFFSRMEDAFADVI